MTTLTIRTICLALILFFNVSVFAVDKADGVVEQPLNPPLYLMTLTSGQQVFVLGTVHTIELEKAMPRKSAERLIASSDFLLDEVNCEPFSNLPGITWRESLEEEDQSEGPSWPYVTQECIDGLRKDLSSIFEHIYIDNPDGLEKTVNGLMNKLCDKEGKWYAKAGLIANGATSDSVVDCCQDSKKEYPHILRIKGNNVIVPTKNGMELHPIALEALLKYALNEPLYLMPSGGGMDDHLADIALAQNKKVYALEEEEDRYGDGFSQELREKIECYGYFAFKNFVNRIKKDPEVLQQNTITPVLPSCYHSGELPISNSPGLLERDDIWVDKFECLKELNFTRVFCYVGCGHLYDLFEKLKNRNIVSDIKRVSLQELEQMLEVASPI